MLSLCIFCLGLIMACDKLPVQSTENTPALHNRHEKITIQGRVIDKNTNEPPQGIHTVNIANKWKFYKESMKSRGENERVFVNKDGYYSITIKKEDTIQFIPYHQYYKQNKPTYKLYGFENNQIINFYVEAKNLLIQEEIENNISTKSELLNLNPSKLVTLSGTVLNKETGKPIENITILSVYDTNTSGGSTQHLTNEEGHFMITLPQNSLVVINPLTPSKVITNVQKDTIITYYL